jgi:hypothetical protein
MKIKAYLSGPITGKPNNNFQFFEAAQQILEMLGYEVVNPHHLDVDLDNELKMFYTKEQWDEYVWRMYMNECMPALGKCHLLFRLPGWKESRGAKLEVETAEIYKIPVFDFTDEMDANKFEGEHKFLKVEWV